MVSLVEKIGLRGGSGGREEEVGFEPLLLSWQCLALRCLRLQTISTVNTAESYIAVSTLTTLQQCKLNSTEEGTPSLGKKKTINFA